ncbi:isochorismatase family protein [Marinobacter sp.]|uniref:isochorismatase family protein n=1 Tax=Marinobacter sp. TaxID=50741 RepID=UPI0035C74245
MDAIAEIAPALETAAVPVVKTDLDLTVGNHGLIVVDEVHGFCTVGRGPLAPTVPNPQIERMIAETERLAGVIGPKLVFRDSHPPGQAEPPYPEHCVRGTGDDELVDALAFLEERSDALVMPKDCISGVIGGMRPDGSNVVFDWAKRTGIDSIVVVGICTDICVLGVVLPLLSARTRGFLGGVKDIVVHEPACATYDLPLAVARSLDLPDSAAHPQEDFHRMGLLIMQNQGAIITG